MAGNVLVVIFVTLFAGSPTGASGDVAPARVPESDVQVVEGEVLSHGARTLVLLDDEDRRLTFELERLMEAPEPLVSGARVRVEFVKRAGALDALVVVLAPERLFPETHS